MINKFLNKIKEEKNGFEFGKPWRYNEDSLFAVLPILNKNKSKRNYITLTEAEKVDIEDSGNISRVLVTNNEDKPVFIRTGEIFKGKTQERAAVVSRIVMPKDTAEIEVVCIHQSKGIRQGTKMASVGFTPSSVENAIRMNTGSNNLQSSSWTAVADYCMALGEGNMNTNAGVRGFASTRPSDDLVQSIKKHSKLTEKILKAIPKDDWQIGMALIALNGVSSIECFDLPDSWTAIHEAAYKKENETLSERLEESEDVFSYNPNKAPETVKKVLGQDFKQSRLYKDSNTIVYSLKNDTYSGETTVFKDKVIHLVLTKQD